MSAITGPIAPYNNVPIEPQFYAPRRFVIEDIVLGSTTLVTTTEDHDYVVGQLVRLIIPPQNGCRQLNEAKGYVIFIPTDDEVILDIDSSQNVDDFVSTSLPNQPQILAIGDINQGAINQTAAQTGTFIPGSFINISPS